MNATGNVLIAHARSRQRVTKLMKMSDKLHLFYITGGAIHITSILFSYTKYNLIYSRKSDQKEDFVLW